MKQDLSIIKILLACILISNITLHACDGCDSTLFGTSVNDSYDDSATAITDRFDELGDNIEEYYNDNIKPLINVINKIQSDTTKMVVHIKALEEDANLDERKLLFLMGNILNAKQLSILKKVQEGKK